MATAVTLSTYVQNPEVIQKFTDVLGDADKAYIIAMLDYCERDGKLNKSEPNSTVNSFLYAASLGLSFDKSINECYFTALKVGQRFLTQFDITYRGLIQLAHRTKEYTTINTGDVRDGELIGINRLTGAIELADSIDQDLRDKLPVLGYVAHFELINGFKKSSYMTVKQLQAHGQKYSNNYGEKWGEDKFPGMAKKTILKLLLDKFGPKSSEMRLAIKVDQAKINDDGTLEYIDNAKLVLTPNETLAEIEKLFTELETKIPASDYGHVRRIIDKKEVNSYSKLLKALEAIKNKNN